MSKFKPHDSKVTTEPKDFGTNRVVKFDAAAVPEITTFEIQTIKRSDERDYAKIKKKYGALAATDQDRVSAKQKDARFLINPLLRESLSIEEEEKRVIEERVRTRVEAVVEEVRERAAKEGYDDGVKKGYEEANKKFREDGAERLRKFDEFLTELETAKHEIFRENEYYLIELIYRVAKMLILKELSTDREYVTRLCREIIDRVGVRENIRIRVNPSDLAVAADLKENLEKSLGTLKNLNVESSNQVKLGGCMIETEWNAIDASIETQLQGVYEGLLGAKQNANGG
jgi:flagellar assembly protein FliH